MPADIRMNFDVRNETRPVRAWQAIEQSVARHDAATVRSLELSKKVSAARAADAAKSTEETQRLLRELEARYQAAQREEKALKQAAALTESLRTPQERYLARLQQLKAQQEQGILTDEVFLRAKQKLQQEYLRESGALERRASALRESQQQQAAANRIVDQSQTAIQRYAAGLKDLRGHLDAGRLTQEQYRAAVSRLKTEYQQESGLLQRRASALRQQQQAQTDVTRIIEQSRTPLQRLAAAEQQVNAWAEKGLITKQQQRQAILALRTAYDQQARSANSAAAVRFDQTLQSIRNVGLAIIGGGGVVAALQMWIDKTNEVIRLSNQVEQGLDPLYRAFRVQSATADQPMKEGSAEAVRMENRIADIAETRRVQLETAIPAATQLVSTGFSAEDASGRALDALLRGLNASNAMRPGTDATGLAKAAGSYLASQQAPDAPSNKTAENLESVLRDVQALFKTTDVQLGDLEEFARVAVVARGRLDQQQQFATFSVLRDVLGSPGEASTAFRQIVGRLSTADASDTKRDALDRLGLKPEDVDLVGESLTDVVDRFRAALANIDEKDRAPILQKLFEEQGAPAFQALLNRGSEELKKRYDAQGSAREQFDRDVASSEAGPARAAVAQDVALKRAQRARADGSDLILKEMEILMTERGAAAISISNAKKAFENEIGLGRNQTDALNEALTVAGYGAAEGDEIRQRVAVRRRQDPVAAADLAQVAGIGVATPDEQRDAAAIAARGYNPSARIDESLRIAREGGFDPETLGLDTQRRFRGGLRALQESRDNLPSGEIEQRIADLIKPTRDAAMTESRRAELDVVITRLEQLAAERRAQPALPAPAAPDTAQSAAPVGRALPAEPPAPEPPATVTPGTQSDADWQSQWEARQREAQRRELVVANARQQLNQIDDPQRREYLQQQFDQRMTNRGTRAPDEVAAEFMAAIQPRTDSAQPAEEARRAQPALPAPAAPDTAQSDAPVGRALPAEPPAPAVTAVNVTMPQELTSLFRGLTSTMESMMRRNEELMRENNAALAALNKPPLPQPFITGYVRLPIEDVHRNGMPQRITGRYTG